MSPEMRGGGSSPLGHTTREWPGRDSQLQHSWGSTTAPMCPKWKWKVQEQCGGAVCLETTWPDFAHERWSSLLTCSQWTKFFLVFPKPWKILEGVPDVDYVSEGNFFQNWIVFCKKISMGLVLVSLVSAYVFASFWSWPRPSTQHSSCTPERVCWFPKHSCVLRGVMSSRADTIKWLHHLASCVPFFLPFSLLLSFQCCYVS